MTINTGVNVSKGVGFGVLDIPKGVDISKAVGFAVLDGINPPVWPPMSMPDGIISNPYSFSWDLTPATPPTTYSVLSGSLPTGLSLTSPSGDIGTISGTPTVLGLFSFTLRATNTYGIADKAFTITIVAVTGGGGSYTFIT